MNLREALNTVRGRSFSKEKKLSLLTRFEPLHLKTFLQAFLVQRFKEDVPEVLTFGFDNMESAFQETSIALQFEPAVLFLSWGDIHPDLEWRSRGKKFPDDFEKVQNNADQLSKRFVLWLQKRKGVETFGIFPPLSWIAHLDEVPTRTIGSKKIQLGAILFKLMNVFHQNGGRVLNPDIHKLNFRDIFMAGHPLLVEDSESIASLVVEVAYPKLEMKKAVIVDLDETIWGGVIGEGGVDQLQWSDDGPGKTFFMFQKFLKKIRSHGIFLCFCSKNNMEDVVSVFNQLGMPLQLSDFTSYRCNWDSKSKNINEICRDLNIGPSAAIYIDDNPAELNEISSQLPALTMFQTPADANGWENLITKLQNLLAKWELKREDKIRMDRIPSVGAARKLINVQRSNSWGHLKNLQLSITLNGQGFCDSRSVELINKTNQFNLTGERISGGDWMKWKNQNDTFCLSANLTDRYGDFGTIAVITGAQEENRIFVRNMVLSCRAFGRGVEYALIQEVVSYFSASLIEGLYKETGKNIPAKNFLNKLGIQWLEAGKWQTDSKKVSALFHQIQKDSGLKILVTPYGKKERF